MSKLSKFRHFFSPEEQLSVNALRMIRGGSGETTTIQPVAPSTTVVSEGTLPPTTIVYALDDNKRPERPGGGVSTH